MLNEKQNFIYLKTYWKWSVFYTTVFLCLTSFSFAQSLSFPEALERMRGANQKLKGMEKQTEASYYGEKEL